ncbi:hypothetical protein ABZ901_06250 [Actinacidiphila alni]|uniref:hypothetical protein n=1 Tax=Actinacidiphila alni TaxID=380248 RepID=UPI0033C58006
MLTVNPRKASPVVVLAVVLVLGGVACGSGSADDGPRRDRTDGAPPSVSGTTTSAPTPTSTTEAPPTGGAATPVTGSVAERVVYFSTSVRAPRETHEVLHDRGEVQDFAETVATSDAQAAAKIAASGAATDFARSVLVGWAVSTGCSAATSATLLAAGDTLRLHVVQPKPPPECFTDFRLTVVFEVPKERLPAHPAFA